MKRLLLFAVSQLVLASVSYATPSDTFEVTAGQIAPDIELAKIEVTRVANENATAICLKNGYASAVQVSDLYDCRESYSVHGQSLICKAKFYCE